VSEIDDAKERVEKTVGQWLKVVLSLIEEPWSME
jgi:hypothetical protein